MFKTKVELAVEMLEQICAEGFIPFRYVVADVGYGNSIDFINAVEKHPGVVYFLAVPSDTFCWLKPPVTASSFVLNLNSYFWYRRVVSEGAKGPIAHEFARRRGALHRGGLPCKEVWLIVKRTLGPEPVYSYYISNAPRSVHVPTLIWLSGARWAIEQCFEETKSELGMDHYEVRKFPGWHHYMLTTMLAHFFLWHLKTKLGKKAPSVTLSQPRILLERDLPLRKYDVDDTIYLVIGIKKRNYNVYLSHRKRKCLS